MIAAYYQGMFYVSILLAIIYMIIWHKRLDTHITLMFILVPITNMGYFMASQAHSLEAAVLASKLTYIGGCFLLLDIMMGIFSLCDIKIPMWLKVILLVLSCSVYMSVLSADQNTLFYKSVSYRQMGGAVVLDKEFGIMHHVFYAMVFLYFVMSLWALAYSYAKKNQVSRKIIALLFIPEAASMAGFFLGRPIFDGVDIIPAAYNIALLIFLLIVYRISLYNISDSAIESMVQSGETGFVSFDFKMNYLGSNATAKRMMPALSKMTVDRPASKNKFVQETVIKWLEDFKQDETKDTVLYEEYGTIYLVNITYLYDGIKNRGYQLFIKDDTKNQEYIKLINSFNSELRKEVDAKTEHIIEVQDSFVLGMATVVESRDNSTGGHIKRTSDVVRMLVNEIKKENIFDVPDSFFRNVIKAAPMHDFGKIAVDDAILRKPGKLTPEEYASMKTHAAEGARIVREILKGTDDKEFSRIAENVAHYHHEYWDGSGYPKGLKGDQIPLEARIMAIADVYDALASRRAYKEGMPADKINDIILTGMGIQFDRALEPYYLRARKKIEDYYTYTEH
ncbi:MAG: HD domain-containing protein [Firmicutes bacterium]|nr:HD domain-containing protein [Bacillota bacterium]